MQLEELFLTKAASAIYCEEISEEVRIKKMVELAKVREVLCSLLKKVTNRPKKVHFLFCVTAGINGFHTSLQNIDAFDFFSCCLCIHKVKHTMLKVF